MTDYISREAFLEERQHIYCAKRKGMKNGKMKFVYDIGDAPCRSCGIGDVLDDVAEFPAANVREVVTCGECRKLYECRFSPYLGLSGFCSWGERKEK